MSTKFGLLKYKPKLDGYGCLHEEDKDIPYVEIAKRNREIYWINDFDIISKFLSDETPVYPLDNTPQRIFTIKDIKEAIKKQNERI